MNTRILHLTPPAPNELIFIGRIELAGVTIPYPKNRRDIDADTNWSMSLFKEMGIRDNALSLFISSGAESVQVWPYQNAAMHLESPQTFVEDSPHDAYRLEMFLRRFPLQLQLVFGLTSRVIKGLLDGGHDLQKIFSSVQHVVAHADAWEHLSESNVRAWRLISLGATYAIEEPTGGGARYNQSEWFVEEKNGELLLTSLTHRAAPFVRMRTGVKGSVTIQGSERRIFLAN